YLFLGLACRAHRAGTGDRVRVEAVVVEGVRARAQSARRGLVREWLGVPVAPVDRDRPRAVRTRVAERAEREAVRRALVGALVALTAQARRHVLHDHVGRVLAVAAVLVDDPAAHGVGAGVVEGALARGAR